MFRWGGLGSENPSTHFLGKAAIEHVKKHTAAPVSKKPFTRKLLQTLLDKVDEENFLELRDTFMFTLGRKGTMRASEVVNLEDTDVWEEKVEGDCFGFIFDCRENEERSISKRTHDCFTSRT